MKVAFSTSNGCEVDQLFGRTSSYSVWDIGPREAYYVHTVFAPGKSACKDDDISARVEALQECLIVCSCGINGPSVAKLAAHGIHAMRTSVDTSVEEIIGRLQDTLRGCTPPWLRKEMLQTPWLLEDAHIWR